MELTEIIGSEIIRLVKLRAVIDECINRLKSIEKIQNESNQDELLSFTESIIFDELKEEFKNQLESRSPDPVEDSLEMFSNSFIDGDFTVAYAITQSHPNHPDYPFSDPKSDLPAGIYQTPGYSKDIKDWKLLEHKQNSNDNEE